MKHGFLTARGVTLSPPLPAAIARKRRGWLPFSTLLIAGLFFGSPWAWAKKFTIDTAPVKQGRVFVNGQFMGVAPVTVDLKVGKNEIMKASAEKEGALGNWEATFSKDENQTVMIRLEEDQASSQTIESDIANKWLTIDPSSTGGPGKTTDEGEMWKKVVSIVTDNFSDVEQLDRSSFYLRTAWRVRRYPYTVIRNRLIVKRGVTPHLTVRVEIESQVYRFTDPQMASQPVRDELFTALNRLFPADRDTIQILRDQF
jgi:hypothetical protein